MRCIYFRTVLSQYRTNRVHSTVQRNRISRHKNRHKPIPGYNFRIKVRFLIQLSMEHQIFPFILLAIRHLIFLSQRAYWNIWWLRFEAFLIQNNLYIDTYLNKLSDLVLYLYLLLLWIVWACYLYQSLCLYLFY